MDLREDRRRKGKRKLEFENRRRGKQSLYLRLTPEEQRDLSELAQRMGGMTLSGVVEEALRKYLTAIAPSGKFVKDGMAPAPPLARHYKIRADVRTALEQICAMHGWELNEVTRHALMELKNQIGGAEGSGDRRP
jgi:hypothetical protein